MTIAEIVKKENIDIELLQKGLKHIGLNLPKFDNINDDLIPSLIELFKAAIDIDSHATKYKKMDLRLKFEKIIKSQTYKNKLDVAEEPNLVEELAIANQYKVTRLITTQKDPKLISSISKKLGKVKFFDSTKGFGYVYNLDDKKDCFIHISKILTSPITEDDIVIFETVDSIKKPGEFDAVKVSTKIPVLILNKTGSSKSFAIPLLDNHFTTKIQLTEKISTGFYVAKLAQKASFWKVFLYEPAELLEHELIYLKKILLSELSSSVITDKNTVTDIVAIFKDSILPQKLAYLYDECVNLLEHNPIFDIEKIITLFKGNNIFEEIINRRTLTLNKLNFVLWLNDELEKLPEIVDYAFWETEILAAYSWEGIQNILLKLLQETGVTSQVLASYKYLLEKGWLIETEDKLEIITDFLRIFIEKFPEIKILENHFICKNNVCYVRLFQEGILENLSTDRLILHIDSLKSNDLKARFIETLPTSDILKWYSLFPTLASYKDKYITGILEHEFSKLNYICFDLESNGNQITEFAWKTNILGKSHRDFQRVDDGIRELVSQINEDRLIIGQNIKEFDLTILQKYSELPSTDSIWDTLEVEMLLNPQRFSYGLKTTHSASFDTDLTFELFKNQLLRFFVSPQYFDDVRELLPSKAIAIINHLHKILNWQVLDSVFLDSQSDTFFRPNPTHQPISAVTFNQLKECIEDDGNKILIAPTFLWNTLSYQFRLNFYNDNTAFSLFLSKEKVESSLVEDKRLKAILLRFVDCCALKGIKPYYQHLPIAIRLKLTEEKAMSVCECDNLDFNNRLPTCFKPTDIENIKNNLPPNADIKIIVIGYELYHLTSKMPLGQDLDFATIFDKLKNEPIWLQMSGGKSFISIEKRHCELLGIQGFPEYLRNIWLEKIGKGKFKVWCNINFEDCIKALPTQNVTYINWVDNSINNTNSYIVTPNAKKSYIAEQKRVNPESLYRKIYWVYQFKIIERIGTAPNPKVLIVNDELELEKLSAYARRKGYFVPDNHASLARQIEILHNNKAKNKLLLTTFQNLDAVISCNYLGSLDFIWDSFLLQEKLQMLKGIIDSKIAITDEPNKDDSHSDNAVRKEKTYDLFSLIKLHKPLMDYYYQILRDNNPESQLFLCDTRFSDYNGIDKSLNVNTKSVQMWDKESEYEADIQIALDFFPSIHENADTNFDIEEAKKILRHIFLPLDEKGVHYLWHDYQIPCLNEILPAKKDLLISLPTGAGKSLLFQAPALFRSAFSCKLSIVISPLRALMQDQVDGLWNKGFYSNVEFLSGDKSQVEIRDIYRRVAGGEITLLYITPERFRSRSFENCLLTRLDADSGLEFVVFDEAHCISQWGQEFRPDYLNAGRKIADFSKVFEMRKLLFSATISEQVFEEISRLMPGITPVEGTEKSYNPVRDHIKMDFKHNVIQDEQLDEIANYLKLSKFNPKLSRAIVFVKSRKKVEECSLVMTQSLKSVFGENCSFSEKVGAFHAGMDSEDRKETYDRYKTGEIVLLFATKAFGMGMDIPNIHFVTHYSPPSTFEDFLQEVGRAGRNEKQRINAGFDNIKKPIKTLCLITPNDFAKLKDQLHKSRISWHEIKDIKDVVEEYISLFKPLVPDTEIPIAIPFNLYSSKKGVVEEELDNKFRIALHWLERLERIKLGYFTITHLKFETASLNKLSERINQCPDNDCQKVCQAIIYLMPNNIALNEAIQFSIASLRSISKLSLENLFSAILKTHKAGILKLLEEVVIEPTKKRFDEINHCRKDSYGNQKYPALQVVFSLASKILTSVSPNSPKYFDGDELDDFIKESVDEIFPHDLQTQTISFRNVEIKYRKLPWSKMDEIKIINNEDLELSKKIKVDNSNEQDKNRNLTAAFLGLVEKKEIDSMSEEEKKELIHKSIQKITVKLNIEYNNYRKDIFKKRSKHAFTVIRLIGKIKHETKMDKVIDGKGEVSIKQMIFNGYHKKEEWSSKISLLKKDCLRLLDYIAENYFDKNIKNFNWANIISELGFKENIQYLSDLLFILSVLGYNKTGELLPTGIEVYLTSIEKVDEIKVESHDNKIYEDFLETQEIRELKLMSLQVLSQFKGDNLRDEQDDFIKGFFAAQNKRELINLLESYIESEHPIFKRFRGDAIKTEEDRLNIEQRKVYDSEINQHINVMAGPGSGKTHTLALRVAKLIHHNGVNPEEILVLAYNRAVVSELKERLGRLFSDLGYGNLAKRIKIFTFHGLAKRYCQNEVKEKPFDEWEKILLNTLNNTPGQIMNELAPLKHILVDEFQDINKVRINLLDKLHQLTKAYLFIIGDPNQSIYGYDRIKEGGSISPWQYYEDFNLIFKPSAFELYDNHRSYPDILTIASEILSLPDEHKHLIPKPTKIPDENFLSNYVEVIDRTQTQETTNWWSKLETLLEERIGEKQIPYKQIAILFRTNNEVYRGFQKIKGLNIPNVRIRIQGSMPYEFTRIRECHYIILYLRNKIGLKIPSSFRSVFSVFIADLIAEKSNWNHFYIRVTHALVLEYLQVHDEGQLFDDLIDFISELTYQDDGQLYKIYEKHREKVSDITDETEIVLTTMHKVKGLEFDAVIIPPSFSNLLPKSKDMSDKDVMDYLDEEKRLAYVSYTRARYRLVVFLYDREIALRNNEAYQTPENVNISLGIPVEPEIKKLKISWSAKRYNFNSNAYINNILKSGDFITVKKRVVSHTGSQFNVYELFEDNGTTAIGEIANDTSILRKYSSISGFVVNEIVVWTYEETRKYDLENNTNFAREWCQDAINQGYIYLVDFAGFGVPKQ